MELGEDWWQRKEWNDNYLDGEKAVFLAILFPNPPSQVSSHKLSDQKSRMEIYCLRQILCVLRSTLAGLLGFISPTGRNILYDTIYTLENPWSCSHPLLILSWFTVVIDDRITLMAVFILQGGMVSSLYLWSLKIIFYSYFKGTVHQIVSIERDRPFPLKLCKKNRLFLRLQLSLESKTFTNQPRISCLVYPEITQISERSL